MSYRSASAPNNGFDISPNIGKIEYIIPTTNVEKPNCLANTGINGTTAPVPITQHVDGNRIKKMVSSQ